MMNQAQDRSLLQKVNQRLARTASGGKTRVTASVRKGEVTLAGTLQYEIHRRNFVRAASSVSGVTRVVDQMQAAAVVKKGH